MPVVADKPAPYTAPSAVLGVIERHRSRGLPAPINAEVLERAGIVSAGLMPRTMQALQTLDLIDAEGKPTKTLEGLRLAPENEYRKRLEDWLKSAYADIFAFVDPSKDSDTQIRDAFRTYNPVGQQGRMVTLFQGLCAAAGLVPEKSAPQPRPAARGPIRPPSVQTIRNLHSLATQSKRTAPARDIPPAIAGLLASLPTEGWTKAERDKFLKTFETVLDFAVPVITRTAKKEEDE